MKKDLICGFLALSIVASGVAFGAKYTVNTSGTVKKNNGTVISSPANVTNQNVNLFNTYNAQTYVATNQVNKTQAGIIEIVMDYSGSMANWIGVAKRSMSQIVAQIPQSTLLGFRVFGHDMNGKNPDKASTLRAVKKLVKKGNKYTVVTEKCATGQTTGACAATAQVAPIVAANSNRLLNGMNSVNLGGATPLVYGLDRAVYQDLASFDQSSPKKIVLITDGGENCGGDPCEFARQLAKKRSDVHIDVVLVSSGSTNLACLSNITGGRLYRINNLADFSTTITDAILSEPVNTTPTYQQNYEYVGE